MNELENSIVFTGLVEGMGKLVELVDEPPGKRLVIDAGEIASGAAIGDSVALNGCCLTVVAVSGSVLEFEAGKETLSRTNLGELQCGDSINLERSLRMGDRLGGHLVTGHIDTVARVMRRDDEGEWSTFWFQLDRQWMHHLASKGSVAVDGVSLTVVDVNDNETAFSVALIPHTLEVTTLGRRQVGDSVNIETDLLAKYVERQLAREAS